MHASPLFTLMRVYSRILYQDSSSLENKGSQSVVAVVVVVVIVVVVVVVVDVVVAVCLCL